MTANLLERVVADQEKFSIRLGVPHNGSETVGKPLATGGVCATIAALVAAHIAGPATVVKILGVTLYASSGPIGWAIGAGAAAFVAGCSAHVLGRKMAEGLGTTGTYKKDFDGDLSEIGRLVADIVFRPMAALAMPDWGGSRSDFLLNEFDRWGYDRAWSKNYVAGLSECGGEVLVPTVEIISQRGFGERPIKDKSIKKRHLVDHAIKNLDAAALEFGGDQEMLRERRDAISRQLKEKIVD